MSTFDLSSRKSEHMKVCLESGDDLRRGETLLDEIRLVHRILPGTGPDKIDTETRFLGHNVRMPLFISPMSGGSRQGNLFNRDLARAAEKALIPMGTGSVRILFDHPEFIPQFRLKKWAPSVPVFANLGAAQLRTIPFPRIISLLEELEVQGVSIHLNPAQELFQMGGEADFSGIRESLYRFMEKSPIPVIVKETGFGVSPDDVLDLLDHGAAYVDLAGSGGTSWIQVEVRNREDIWKRRAEEFDEWGHPAALVLNYLKGSLPEAVSGKLLGSGGVRTSHDLVKLVALGARMAGLALPLLQVWGESGEEGLHHYLDEFRWRLLRVMTLCGCRTVSDIKSLTLLKSSSFTARTREYKKAFG